MQPLQGIRPLIVANRFDRLLDPAAIGSETISKSLEEREAVRAWCGAIARQQGLRQSHAGCFTSARQKQFAHGNQVELRNCYPITLATEQGPSPFGQRVDEIPKECRGVSRSRPRAVEPHAWPPLNFLRLVRALGWA